MPPTLHPVALTSTGRPVLSPGEYEIATLDKVDLEFDGLGGLPGRMAPAYKGGYIILTSTRVVWMQQGAGPNCCAWPVGSMGSWAKKAQLGLTGQKVWLVLQCYVDGSGTAAPPQGGGRGGRTAPLMLRCRGESPDALAAQLEATVAAAARQAAARAQLPSPADLGAPPPPRPLGYAESPYAMPMPPPPPPPQPPPPAPTAQLQPAVNSHMLQQMVEMGFPRWRAARSLLAVKNTDLQAALDHLLAFGDAPGEDEPFDLITGLPLGAAPAAASRPPVYPGTPATAAPAAPLPPPGVGLGPLAAGLAGMQMRQQQGSQQAPGGAAAFSNPLLGQQRAGLPPPPPPPQYSHGGAVSAGGSASPPYYPGSEWGSEGGSSTYTTAGSQGGAGMYAAYGNPLLASAGLPPGAPIAAQGPSVGPPVPSGVVGVSGLVRREAAKAADTGRALDSAFQDLQALMCVAADMVALAERLRATVASQGGPGAKDEALDADTAAQLIALGIASPVTRTTAGGRYYEELARQLADWLLAGPLERAGGMMPVTDVYCLFNRARGSELVSPDDLLEAVKLFKTVGAPMSLRTLPSTGMLVVQGVAFSPERVCDRVAALVAPSPTAPQPALGPPISASDVALALGCSTLLAAEHLAMAEARGVLCRDNGPEGLRFFRNFFTDAMPLLQPAR